MNHEKQAFLALLSEAGLSQAGLARLLGLNDETPYNWSVVPQYAMAYVELLVKQKRIAKMLSEPL